LVIFTETNHASSKPGGLDKATPEPLQYTTQCATNAIAEMRLSTKKVRMFFQHTRLQDMTPLGPRFRTWNWSQ